MWIFTLLIIIVFFILSGFFSGSETGLISIDRLKIEQDSKTNKRKKQILDFLENPERLFGTTLFGTNISVVIVSSLSIYLINLLKQRQQIAVSDHAITLVIAGLILIFAEIIPKNIYRDNPNKMVTRSFPLLRFFALIFQPFLKFVSLINSMLAKLFKLSAQSGYHLLTKEDISYLLSETEDDGLLHEDQRDMLEEALEFRELDAENVMIHRTEIVAFEKNTPVEQVIEVAREQGFTRFPVFENDLDHIIGILIIYDLINRDPNVQSVAGDFIRKAYFAPETTDIDHLLTEMQTHKKSMVIIVDSFGGTAGLITMEDILEEIVGEIEDEYDTNMEDVEKISENHFLVNGDVRIDYLNDEFELNLPEGDYETIAGLMIDKLEKIPRQGNMVKAGFWNIKAIQVSNRKIIRIELKKPLDSNEKN